MGEGTGAEPPRSAIKGLHPALMWAPHRNGYQREDGGAHIRPNDRGDVWTAFWGPWPEAPTPPWHETFDFFKDAISGARAFDRMQQLGPAIKPLDHEWIPFEIPDSGAIAYRRKTGKVLVIQGTDGNWAIRRAAYRFHETPGPASSDQFVHPNAYAAANAHDWQESITPLLIPDVFEGGQFVVPGERNAPKARVPGRWWQSLWRGARR